MIITQLIEHIPQDEEVVYILKKAESGKTIVFVCCIIDERLETMSKEYDTQEEAIQHIKDIEFDLRFTNGLTVN